MAKFKHIVSYKKMRENSGFHPKCRRQLVKIVDSEEPRCNLKVQNPQVKKRTVTHLVLQKKKWLRKNSLSKIPSPMFLIITGCPLKLLGKSQMTLWFLMKKMKNLIFQISLRVRLKSVTLVKIMIRSKQI